MTPGAFSGYGMSTKRGGSSTGTIIKVVMLLLLLSACAACITGDVIWGKGLKNDKCGITNTNCWKWKVSYISVASCCCLIATFVGLMIIKRMI